MIIAATGHSGIDFCAAYMYVKRMERSYDCKNITIRNGLKKPGERSPYYPEYPDSFPYKGYPESKGGMQ
jgi:hypothetical protein